jgi:hypothetical protein
MAKSRNPRSSSRKFQKSKSNPARSCRFKGVTPRSHQGTLEIKKYDEHDLRKAESSPLSCGDAAGMNHVLDKLHPQIVANTAYVQLCRAMGVSEEFIDAAIPAALAFSEQMHPADPLERLALSQALIAHTRAAWLAHLATRQTDAHSICAMNEACGRASNTFSRLMAAIQQYRRPAASTTTVSIAQANVASQQVVQNLLKQESQKDDDQTGIGKPGALPKAAELLPIAERPALFAIKHQTDAAVDAQHRTAICGGNVTSRNERAKARRTVSRKNRFPKAGERDN